jgi:hypothetical protein
VKFKVDIIDSNPPLLETHRSWKGCGNIINLFHENNDLIISVGEDSELGRLAQGGVIRYLVVGKLNLGLTGVSVEGWITPEGSSIGSFHGDVKPSGNPFSRPTSRVNLRLMPLSSISDIKFKIDILESVPPLIEASRSWKDCGRVVKLFHEDDGLIISAGELRYLFRGVDIEIGSDKISTRGWITPDSQSADLLPLYETIQPNSISRVDFNLVPV